MNEIYPKISLKVAPGRTSAFLPLCRRGIYLGVKSGSVLHEFLKHVGFTEEYLETRVQTIFLDGKVIDDPHHETIGAGSVIALSAALPGLVGAMFRKKSPVAPLRTRAEKPQSTSGTSDGLVLLKLFNIVAAEMGPILLGREIIVRRGDLEEELAMNKLLGDEVTEALLNGKSVDPGSIIRPGFTDSEYIRLTVTE